jgi:ABC-type iron transport system FetAB permease component
MNANNPYEAPKAFVADVPDVNRTGPPGRPLSVGIAFTLLWTSLAIGVLLVLWRLVAMANQGIALIAGLVTFAIVTVLGAVMFFWILRAVAKGHNWGRVTVLVLSIVGSLATLTSIQTLMDRSAIDVIVRFAMWLAATVLLFMPASTAWYRAMTEWRKAN